MTDRERELFEAFFQRGFRIAELEETVSRLEAVLKDGVCKTCGGVSWDIPLADYCRCEGKCRGIQKSGWATSGDDELN